MAWHFDPDTGSPFWIERARTLEFDPLTDVKTHADLALFPNVTGELRDVPVTKLIPRGYGARPDVISVIESGGTTGAPKALPLMADFARLMVERDVWIFEHYGLTREKNWLCFSPGGPHGAADEMIVASDLAMVYGGQDVIDKYRDANLLPQGPAGRKSS